ncbi:unnamed protein product, partial [Amoebophrya sp. A120]
GSFAASAGGAAGLGALEGAGIAPAAPPRPSCACCSPAALAVPPAVAGRLRSPSAPEPYIGRPRGLGDSPCGVPVGRAGAARARPRAGCLLDLFMSP